ncbi:hypothetical protein [Streptomyces sp. NPDC050287]|uniref:hypothetical protein n=1 Tax=Streptomyces sp. NPDC050287 TaxID=3365608 RepID=UPI0037B94027
MLGTLGTAAAALLLLVLLAGNAWAVTVLFCVLGAPYFATIPALNSQLVASAGPTSAAMALTVNNSAFCVGITLGSWLGGAVLAGGHSVLMVPAGGAVPATGGLLLSGVTGWLLRGKPATGESRVPASV